MKNSKDLFSQTAQEYAKYRPSYPDKLFTYLSSLTQDHICAWDCATGNGQAALSLTKYYNKVIATDLSGNQIANAIPHPQIEYLVAPAHDSKLKAQSVDLVTVAQAFHWLDKTAFVKEVVRVVKPSGVLAIWCYGLASVNPPIDAILYNLYANILGAYWEPERKLVDNYYRDITLPFDKITAPTFEMTAEWNYEHLIGYLKTWSAVQKYILMTNQDPLCLLLNPLKQEWKNNINVRWILEPKIWRI